jgi:hypothetical protein
MVPAYKVAYSVTRACPDNPKIRNEPRNKVSGLTWLFPVCLAQVLSLCSPFHVL